jgi:hypothetical protein
LDIDEPQVLAAELLFVSPL